MNSTTRPPVDSQAFKFHHLRYKIFPHDVLSIDSADFFKQVGMSVIEAYSHEEDRFTEAALVQVGGLTAAYKIDDASKSVKVGLCKCSISDLYKKEIGRTISSGRYLKSEGSQKVHGGVLYVNLTTANDVDMPVSVIVREHIIDEVNSGELKMIERDMASIRSYVAGKTKYPFYVELS